MGLALNQHFESWSEALQAVRRISRWKIADASDLAGGARHRVEFRFRLDLSQLPRPLQIGTLGESDWSVELSKEQSLDAE